MLTTAKSPPLIPALGCAPHSQLAPPALFELFKSFKRIFLFHTGDSYTLNTNYIATKCENLITVNVLQGPSILFGLYNFYFFLGDRGEKNSNSSSKSSLHQQHIHNLQQNCRSR